MPHFRSSSLRSASSAIAAAVLLALPLAACSSLGINVPGVGSVDPLAAADTVGTCSAAAETVNGVLADARQQAPQLIAELIVGQAPNASELVDPVLRSVDAAHTEATDPAVRDALTNVRTEWGGLATDLQAVTLPDLSSLDLGSLDLGSLDVGSLDLSNLDLSNLGSLDALAELEQLQRSGADLTAVLSERLPALQQTATELQEACTAAQASN